MKQCSAFAAGGRLLRASCRWVSASQFPRGCLPWQPVRPSRSSAPRRALRDRGSPPNKFHYRDFSAEGGWLLVSQGESESVSELVSRSFNGQR